MTDKSCQHKNLYFSILGILFAIALTVLTLNRYIRDADEAYQIINAQDWQNAPFAPLSAYIGHVWGSIWGFGWLPMRVLSMILNVVSISLCGWYSFRITRNAPRAIWLTAGAIVLYALTNDHEQKYDWDTFASFSITATAVCIMCYVARARTRLIAFAGVLAGMTIMMRMPSAPVLVIPVITIILCNRLSGIKLMGDLGVYLLSAGITVLAIIAALYGSPQGLMQSIEDNSIGQHSAGYILHILIHSIKVMGIYVVVLAGAFMLVKRGQYLSGDSRFGASGVLIILLALGGFYIRRLSGVFDYPYIGLMVFTLISGIWCGRKQWREGMSADMTVMLLGGLACIAGSNCGFNRMIVYPFIPIVAAYIIMLWPRWAQRAELICFGAFSISMLLIVQTNLRVFADGHDNTLYKNFNSEKARGVYFDKADIYWFENVVPAIERYKAEGCRLVVLSEYVDGFIIEYLTDTPNPVTRHDWDLNTLRFDRPLTVTKAIEAVTNTEGCARLFVVLSPAFDGVSNRDFYAMDARLHRIEQSDHYIVWSK